MIVSARATKARALGLLVVTVATIVSKGSARADETTEWLLNLPQTGPKLEMTTSAPQALDGRIAKLTRSMTVGDDRLALGFRKLLNTPAGRLVVARQVTTVARTLERQRVARALEAHLEGKISDGIRRNYRMNQQKLDRGFVGSAQSVQRAIPIVSA